MSELRWLTFTSCCFIAYYCALLSSRSRFRQLQSSQGTRRGWATRSWWGYWWGTYRKPHIIHTHQPQHVTPNEASAAFKWLIAHCLQLSLDPLLILRSGLSSNSSWLALASLGFRHRCLPGSQECFDTGPDRRRGEVLARSPQPSEVGCELLHKWLQLRNLAKGTLGKKEGESKQMNSPTALADIFDFLPPRAALTSSWQQEFGQKHHRPDFSSSWGKRVLKTGAKLTDSGYKNFFALSGAENFSWAAKLIGIQEDLYFFLIYLVMQKVTKLIIIIIIIKSQEGRWGVSASLECAQADSRTKNNSKTEKWRAVSPSPTDGYLEEGLRDSLR